MKLSNTSQYAIRILTYMADKQDIQRINAKDLSQTLDIPYKFLTKIMTDLVRVGFIVSIRGREGGYKLEKKTSEISIEDILEIFHDEIKDEACILGIGYCNSICKCALHDQWLDSKIALQKMFKESSIETLVGEGHKV
jgi:Rrf2 family protein